MLIQFFIIQNFCAASIRILTKDASFIQQGLNISWNVINSWISIETAWTPILLNKTICNTISTVELLAVSTAFRMSDKVGADPALKNI
jgi:hypothetical protein